MAQVIKADMDEMVFEDRERRYGAYFLRKRYGRHLLMASLIGVAAFSLALAAPAIGSFLGGKMEKKEKREIATEINLADLPPPPPPDDEPPPPPPPKVELPPPKLKTIAFKIPEPKPKEEIQEEEEVVEIKELEEAPNIGLEDIEGDDEGFIDIPDEGDGEVVAVIEEAEPDINAFVFASQEPEPINMDDVRELIGYPDIAREANIEGQVVVRVLVDEDGNYQKHKIIKKAHPILAEAVEKHVRKLRFTPAVQGNKPIKFWVNIPFAFKLLN
ncbi:MAG: energy transducer TonB [Bacteroidia bacterium]